jgi:hypothetical protein
LPDEFNPGLSPTIMPFRPRFQGEKPGLWYVYELPRPNVGNYSPTQIITAASAADIMSKISAPGFNFVTQAVLSSAIEANLVPARDMRFSIIRGGLHVSGKSDGTSLVLLPQQFSNCLRPRDPKVRLVRANLMMTGMIFSGEVDTELQFDYGLFTPACRRTDLADMKRLDLTIDLRMAHLSGGPRFPDWEGAVSRLRSAWRAIQ